MASEHFTEHITIVVVDIVNYFSCLFKRYVFFYCALFGMLKLNVLVLDAGGDFLQAKVLASNSKRVHDQTDD